MKLELKDVVYIQKKDADFILYEINDLPERIKNGLLKNSIVFSSSPEDGQRFDCAFEDPEDIKWLNEQDWLDDFEKCSKQNTFALEVKSRDLCNQRVRKIARFNDRSRAYRLAHYADKHVEIKKMERKALSLVELKEYLEGTLAFVFPEGYNITK